MLITFIATGLIGLCILLLCEYLICVLRIKGEYARKLVHISIACYAATWAFFINPTGIALISLILIGAVIVMQKYPIMRSLQTAQRITYGELWYPLGIGLSAILFTNPIIYALAVLHMGLADGMAAVVGVSMGKRAGKFKINNHTKSVAGTLAFIVVSFGIFLMYWLVFSNAPLFRDSLLYASIISLSSAVIVASIEVFAPKGSDNILVPITAGLLAILPAIQFIV